MNDKPINLESSTPRGPATIRVKSVTSFDVLRRLSETSDRETMPGWLSTHPDPGERVTATRAAAQQWITQLSLTPERMVVNRDAHLRNIDGLVFGDNPREGFVEEGRFYHPELQFQISFPAGWQVENTRTAVYAIAPDNAAQIQFKLAMRHRVRRPKVTPAVGRAGTDATIRAARRQSTVTAPISPCIPFVTRMVRCFPRWPRSLSTGSSFTRSSVRCPTFNVFASPIENCNPIL